MGIGQCGPHAVRLREGRGARSHDVALVNVYHATRPVVEHEQRGIGMIGPRRSGKRLNDFGERAAHPAMRSLKYGVAAVGWYRGKIE
jgi:hypothetical protein